MRNLLRLAPFLVLALVLAVPALRADEEQKFHCEVLSLTGSAAATGADGETRALKEGDLVEKGETVATDAESVLDLAFDKEWKNVTRLEEKSKLKVTSVYPGKVSLAQGSVFARLKSLPKDSSFEVKTPTAVATVRGTEYGTSFKDGKSEIINVSESSKVYVYPVAADGSVDKTQELVLERAKKTQIIEAGKAPEPAQDLTSEESQAKEELKSGIETKAQEAQAAGRTSKIQSIAEMEAYSAKKAAHPTVQPNDTDESRVNDTRRRSFKGGS